MYFDQKWVQVSYLISERATLSLFSIENIQNIVESFIGSPNRHEQHEISIIDKIGPVILWPKFGSNVCLLDAPLQVDDDRPLFRSGSVLFDEANKEIV